MGTWQLAVYKVNKNGDKQVPCGPPVFVCTRSDARHDASLTNGGRFVKQAKEKRRKKGVEGKGERLARNEQE